MLTNKSPAVYLTPGGTVSGLSILGGTMMGRKGSILADDGFIYVGPSKVCACKSPDVNLYTHSTVTFVGHMLKIPTI